MRTNKPLWRVILTAGEWDQIWRHVSTCDFPETVAVWWRARLPYDLAFQVRALAAPRSTGNFEGGPANRRGSDTLMVELR
jgi:hypothetical protein